MSRLCSIANGNNTDAATWGLIDSTSFNESETTGITVPTGYSTSYTQFTPGAITIDGIGVRLNSRLGTTGTFSIELYNHTLTASVAGTEVTVDTADFVDGGSVAIDGGWMFFKFGSPVLLLAANAYSVRFKTSTATQITLYATSSTNPSRLLRTTTTQAPAAGDDRFIMGEWTGTGSMTAFNVVPNDTSVVDYGSGSTSQVTPALSISNGGSYSLLSPAAATTYVQKLSGNLRVYNGGSIEIGQSGSRMPTNSSFTWTFDCVANIDFGSDYTRKSIGKMYGESKTRWTVLTGDEAAGQTVISVADTTGWKVGDTLVFSATGTTSTQGETKTILTVDSSTQVTLSAGLTNAHTGTGDCICEVGNLTSNVKIVGASASLCTFVCFRESSTGVLDNVEVQYLGSASNNKRGVECQHLNTSTNSCIFESCAFRDYFSTTNATVGNLQTNGNNYYITNCVMTSATTVIALSANANSSSTPAFDVSNNLIAGVSVNMSIGMVVSLITGVAGICDNNRISGCSSGITFGGTFVSGAIGEYTNFKIHSCTTGINGAGTLTKIISGFDIVSCSTAAALFGGVTSVNNCNFLGNATAGYSPSSTNITTSSLTFNSCIFRGRTSFGQPNGITLNTLYACPLRLTFNDCSFGETIAHTSNDIFVSLTNGATIVFNSCTFASSSEITSTAYNFLDEYGSIQIQRKDDTDGTNVMYINQGIVTPDTTIYRTASPSIRITPKSATIPCTTNLFPFEAFVNSGQTCTPTVYLRESESGDGAAYNGNRVKLYVKANYNAGITSDTLLDTATASSDGTFEALTGTTAAVGDDVVLEFYIVLDGTTGWVNTDDFTYVNA